MQDLIQKLRDQNFKVTIHDIGEDKAVFALAVVIDEPIDIWYVAFAMGYGFAPKMIGKLLVFPQLVVDVKTYDFLCA
jgi:ribosomal protein S12 methylthiotransferase accessory factor YcaO